MGASLRNTSEINEPKGAKGICGTVGQVIQPSEVEEEGGNFLRVRIKLDVTQPPSRGRNVSMGPNKEQWVSFKYKRLPNLYYWCGYLTHDDRNYESWLDSEGTLITIEQKFGPWLHAAPYSCSHK